MDPTTHPSRRRFLAHVSAAAASGLALPSFLTARSPNGKLNVAAIGVDAMSGF